MNEEKRSLIELHIAVFLFGFTAIFGELILLHPLILTWWRVLLASIFFIFLPRVIRQAKRLDRQLRWIYFGIGMIVGLHWLTFYASIKSSNASITLICLATTTFFTALLEPLLLKKKWSILQIALGVAILPGMVLVVEATGKAYLSGILLGLISAVLAATFSTLNKKYLRVSNPMSVTFIEMVSATVLLSLFIPFLLKGSEEIKIWPSAKDWLYLLALALICTNIAYLLALRALRHLSAYISALSINLEPLYGILLAAVLLNQHEELNTKFYIGALIIILAVVGYPVFRRMRRKRKGVVYKPDNQ